MNQGLKGNTKSIAWVLLEPSLHYQTATISVCGCLDTIHTCTPAVALNSKVKYRLMAIRRADGCSSPGHDPYHSLLTNMAVHAVVRLLENECTYQSLVVP